jgi:CTP:molybdopterin cytidylyltransferase MocA
MGLGYSKAYADVAGKPVLALTIEALLASPFIDHVTVASKPGEEDLCRREVVDRFGLSGKVTVIAGGEERQHTIMNLLSAAPPARDLVLIHDGARPLISTRVIHDTLEVAVSGHRRPRCFTRTSSPPRTDGPSRKGGRSPMTRILSNRWGTRSGWLRGMNVILKLRLWTTWNWSAL